MPTTKSLIQRTPGVCGGDACIRDTRITVWLLIALQRDGATADELLAGYPDLTPEDLTTAEAYYRLHPKEIEEAIAGQESEN